MRKYKAIIVFALLALCCTQESHAQYNIDRLLRVGRSALYYEDYVLSMQYFNQAISAKPYLYEPWFYRALAKYHLDDFAGAEADCTEAISRNPYVVNTYDLRGITRIQQKKFGEAVADYTQALRYDPDNRNYWHNRVLCYIQDSLFNDALLQLDTINRRWPRYALAYSLRAEVYIHLNDTASAVEALEKSLDVDPFDGQTWSMRASISLARKQWQEGEQQLDKAIHLLPKNSSLYVNRALARLNQKKLQASLDDYDTAIDLDPNNFLAHYNRGLLRSQVGDDNQAIIDFDFVLRLEPDNIMALVNRAELRERTGDYRGAIDDYSAVIKDFPNFWLGLQNRARCYRQLGMNRKAEADELTLIEAQLYKSLYGRQPKLDPDKLRKRTEIDPDKYKQLVVDDSQEIEHEYQNEFRGKVQNHKVDMEFMPMYALSLEQPRNDVSSYVAYDTDVEQANSHYPTHPIALVCSTKAISDEQSQHYFELIDSLSNTLSRSSQTAEAMHILMQRAIAYSTIQNYEAAIDDLSTYLQIDSTSVIALWQRAASQFRINQYQATLGQAADLQTANVLGDLNHALTLSPQNPYLLYNRATLQAHRKNYEQAYRDYTNVIATDNNMGEAYFNRGLCCIYLGHREAGIADLSKAGELGIYKAYSIIKRYRK